jgi:uncharacterized protein YdcH (DUF465 family)
MTPSELILIDTLTPHDAELAKLVAVHARYENALAAFAERRWLTSGEEAEVRRLKRVKLAARDRIEMILESARAARRAG